ncbi:MAG: sigma-70 family RNA polymerase sigma factor [Polyangiaceae bacterium]
MQPARNSYVFEEVYRAELDFAFRAVRRLGIREADAKDALQEVFLVVHQKLPAFEHRSSLRTWIYGICMNVVSTRRRKASERRELLVESSSSAGFEPRTEPQVKLDEKRAAAMLDHVLDSLPMEQRAVFTLFELEGLPCTEIATLVDAPLGTVYSRLRLARETFERGITRIRAQLGESDVRKEPAA